MTHSTLNFQTATGHQVLAAAGKKMLRPGGKIATEQLFQWATFQPGETVLELAASFGYSAIALAQRYNVKVVGIEKNPDSVERAKANIAAAGLTDRVQIIEGDIFQLDQLTEQFDYVLAEAILSMQSPAGKAKILAGVADRLKPGGKFLSHELLAQHHPDQIQKTLSQVIKVNVNPLSEVDWMATCEVAGLVVQHHQTGEMGLLNWRRMLQDEGIFGTLKIVWNILTKPQIRTRVLAMRRAFVQHDEDLGYMALCATKPDSADLQN